jgi:restriction system protein
MPKHPRRRDMPTPDNLWFVRAGKGSSQIEDFIQNNLVAIGAVELGLLDPEVSDEELAKALAKAYPGDAEGARAVWGGQIRRFLKEIKPGDRVATYEPDRRLYHLGTVESDPKWRDHEALPRYREVKWTNSVQRDLLSTATRNSLGAISTLFRPSPAAAQELSDRAVPFGSSEGPLESVWVPPEPEAEETILRAEIQEKAQQFIEDRLARLKWEELQELVAGLLRAMGYRTRVAEPGPDRGVDIFASPDGLGLQEPRIFVEVKHRRGTQIGAQEIRSFMGGRQPGDKCLYVSSGGFSKDAKYEADRSSVPLRLIDLGELRRLLMEHYEGLDSQTSALVPLERLYWPV